MKKTIRIIAMVLLPLLLFSACGKKKAPTVTALDFPSDLTFGVLETKKLDVLSWDSGRCETNTAHRMAETENGYYYVVSFGGMSFLHYADKSNMAYWVPVCNKPACSHYRNTYTCNAGICGQWVVLRDGRLYFSDMTDRSKYPIPGYHMGTLIASSALDGTDRKLAYLIEDALLLSGGIEVGRLVGDKWIQGKSDIDLDGNTASRMFVLDENGLRELDIPSDVKLNLYESYVFLIWGDPYFECNALSSSQLLTFHENEIVGVDMKYIPETGGYISGTTLRIFKENRGYFDIDVTSGKQVKLTDNRIKNSTGMILAPNCIVESNIFGFNYKTRKEAVQMEIFDGQTWHNVQIPKELQDLPDNQWLQMVGITSDSIFLHKYTSKRTIGIYETYDLYRIPLGKEQYCLEFCFTFTCPTSD